jgi:hypothetical protein
MKNVHHVTSSKFLHCILCHLVCLQRHHSLSFPHHTGFSSSKFQLTLDDTTEHNHACVYLRFCPTPNIYCVTVDTDTNCTILKNPNYSNEVLRFQHAAWNNTSVWSHQPVRKWNRKAHWINFSGIVYDVTQKKTWYMLKQSDYRLIFLWLSHMMCVMTLNVTMQATM